MKEYNRIIHIVGIYVWRGKAYLPVQKQFESGIYVDSEPVFVSDLTLKDLVDAIQSVMDEGIKQIPNPKSNEEFKARKSPILTITGCRSWKQLAKTGASYDLAWTEKEVGIEMSCLDKKGRWRFDPVKATLLPPDAPIEKVVEIIIEDIKTRPEVFV